jgi:DNA-binding response OmpR family regulator
MSEQMHGTVLYVDDDDVNRHALSRVFRREGLRVREAATGREALCLAAEKPDLVILDVNLPDINGFEVCRRIKGHPSTWAVPVLHLSGVHVTPADQAHGRQQGADGYLTKPVDPGALLAEARAVLRTHQAEERARAADGQC